MKVSPQSPTLINQQIEQIKKVRKLEKAVYGCLALTFISTSQMTTSDDQTLSQYGWRVLTVIGLGVTATFYWELKKSAEILKQMLPSSATATKAVDAK